MKTGRAVIAKNNKNIFKQIPVAAKSCALVVGLTSPCAFAELQFLDDSSLSNVTGKAGLTIDIETRVHIGEFEYVDAGSMYTKDYSLTGIGGGLVDNLRAKIDVTDGNETLATGFSDVALLATAGFFDTSEADVAWAINEYADGAGGFGKQYGDGDVLIHVTSQDLGFSDAVLTGNTPPPPSTHASNLDNYKNAVDLHIQEAEFGIRASDGSVETALSKNFSVEAYLGYLDIVIKNQGNDFHDTTGNSSNGKPRNILLADSYLGIDAKFRVEDLDIDSTNNATNTIIPRSVTNPYLTLRDMRIHNERGNDTLGSFGFASVQSKLAAAQHIIHKDGDALIHVDGQAIYDINVAWDWDLPHVSFGDTGQSIGSVYLTDFHISDTSLVISAH